MNLQTSSEFVTGLVKRLPWISWELEVNAASDRIKEKGMLILGS